MTEKPLVSVIITTKNEEKNIAACLQSTEAQSYGKEFIESIVVDNNSTDKTKEIAQKFTKNIFNKGNERSMQRNYGAQQAKGKYYMYVDADMTLEKSLIEEAVTLMEKDTQLLALYMPEIVSGSSYWCRVRRFERSFYDATAIDCVRFIRMSAMRQVGGFDENMTGPEDWDFDKKIRNIGKVGITHAGVHHNESDFQLSKYLKKKSYYAESFSHYINKWGKEDPDIKKQFGLYYRYLGVFIEKGKWKKFILHPDMLIGMYFLRFLVGITYLLSK